MYDISTLRVKKCCILVTGDKVQRSTAIWVLKKGWDIYVMSRTVQRSEVSFRLNAEHKVKLCTRREESRNKRRK